MGVINRFLNYFGLQDEQDLEDSKTDLNEQHEVETSAFEQRKANSKNNVVSIHSQKNVRVVLVEPCSYNEVQEVADHLKSRRSIIVNLQRVKREHAFKIIDFLSGTVYALGGHISKLGEDIFLCTPDTVEVTGAITEMLSDSRQDPKTR